MYCKYTAELRLVDEGCFMGTYALVLRVERGDKYWTSEKRITPEDLGYKGVFDLVFDDLKKALKHEMKNQGATK